MLGEIERRTVEKAFRFALTEDTEAFNALLPEEKKLYFDFLAGSLGSRAVQEVKAKRSEPKETFHYIASNPEWFKNGSRLAK